MKKTSSKAPTVYAYGRMSTDRQQISPQVQLKQCKEWFEQQRKVKRLPSGTRWGGQVLDAATSSKIYFLDRPKGRKLLVPEHSGDIIVCAKFNRAFRSAADSERTLDLAKELGIHFVFIDLQIDTSTPNGMAMVGMLSVLSRHERDMIGMRIAEAKALKASKGQVNVSAPWGWRNCRKKLPDGTYDTWFAPDIVQRKVGDWIARQMRNGHGVHDCYKALRRDYKQFGLKRPTALGVIAHMASMSCLGWPPIPVYKAKELTNSILATKYVREGDHEADRAKIDEYLQEHGRPGTRGVV